MVTTSNSIIFVLNKTANVSKLAVYIVFISTTFNSVSAFSFRWLSNVKVTKWCWLANFLDDFLFVFWDRSPFPSPHVTTWIGCGLLFEEFSLLFRYNWYQPETFFSLRIYWKAEGLRRDPCYWTNILYQWRQKKYWDTKHLFYLKNSLTVLSVHQTGEWKHRMKAHMTNHQTFKPGESTTLAFKFKSCKSWQGVAKN